MQPQHTQLLHDRHSHDTCARSAPTAAAAGADANVISINESKCSAVSCAFTPSSYAGNSHCISARR